MRNKHFSPSTFKFYREPLLITEGRMQYLYDHTGRRYLDLIAGIATSGQGHCHPRITAKIAEQLNKVQHISTVYLHDQMSLYAEELTAKLPEGLDCIYLTICGSEANHIATQFARAYTGNYPIINLKNAYHGTCGTQHLTALNTWNFDSPRNQGVEPSAFPDLYRGPFSPAEAGKAYGQQVKDTIDFHTAGKAAMFIAEPIQGAGGINPLPCGMAQEAQKHIYAAGGLYCSDEVQTGFGRCGSHYWGFDMLGVKPDIVTMAKTVGNGMPIGVTACTKEVASSLGNKLTFTTYAANPLAMAAGREVLKVIDEEGMQENCRLRGDQFLKGLRELQKVHHVIGDVRGVGLMIGCELVQDQESKVPVDADFFGDVFEKCKDYGILLGKGGRFGNCFRIQPPMCLSEEDVDFALDVIDQVLKEVTESRKA